MLKREVDALRAENEALRRDLDALKRAFAARTSTSGAPEAAWFSAPRVDIDELQRREAEMREAIELHRAVMDAAPMLLFVKDTDGRYLLANKHFLNWAGLAWDQMYGKTDVEVFPKALAGSFWASDLDVLKADRLVEREDSYTMPDGLLHHFVTTKFPLRDAKGVLRGICGVSTDISAYKRTEEEKRELQAEVIRAQEMTLRALSTPLMPIAKGVIVMPLIGNIDRSRADRILETLLDGIVAHEAATVILDITGVPIVDTDVANSLVKTAKAVKLLGAKVVLTGIQPKIAQTLVDLGADLAGIITQGTLESGIAHVLRR